MTLADSIKKLIMNYGRLALAQAGLPDLMQQAEEMKKEAEKRAQKFAFKAVLVSIALLFLLITLIFVFLAIYFSFLNSADPQVRASLYTALIAFIGSVIMFLVVGSWR